MNRYKYTYSYLRPKINWLIDKYMKGQTYMLNPQGIFDHGEFWPRYIKIVGESDQVEHPNRMRVTALNDQNERRFHIDVLEKYYEQI